MAKHKAPKRIRDMRKEGKAAPPRIKGLAALKAAIGRVPKAAASAIGALVAVSGLLSGYALLTPQVTISATDPLDHSALSAPFIVTNSSLFTIYEIKTACNVEVLTSEGAPRGQVRLAGANDSPWSQRFTELEPGEVASVRCFDPTGNVDYAVVAISGTYRPSWTWKKRTKLARFGTRLTSDGKIRWVPFGKFQEW
jgi:hypothetical protein